jgi:hypothetical protein
MRINELKSVPATTDLAKPAVERGFVEPGNAWKKIAPILQKNCSEILTIYKQAGNFLFRGVRLNDKIAFKSKILKDRRPGYLDLRMHNAFNKAIVKMGGVAHRGNSIFCSAKEAAADIWGTVFIVFPKDGFQVTLFPTYKQDYFFHELAYNSPESLNVTLKKYPPSFDKKLLPKEIKRRAEVLITGDWYIGLAIDFIPFIRYTFKI